MHSPGSSSFHMALSCTSEEDLINSHGQDNDRAGCNPPRSLLPERAIQKTTEGLAHISQNQAEYWVTQEIERTRSYLFALIGLRNSFVPAIHRLLPVEILSRIFTLVREENLTPGYGMPLRWIGYIMLVCRHWREVAVATPPLWNVIYMNTLTASSLELYLIRSRDMDIDLHWYIPDFYGGWRAGHGLEPSPLLPPIFSILLPHMHRLASFEAQSDNIMMLISLMDRLSHISLPRFRILSVESYLSPTRLPPGNSLRLPRVPSLQVLKLYGILIDWSFPKFPVLNRLQLAYCSSNHTRPSVTEVLNILEGFPQLQELVLQGVDFKEEPEGRIHDRLVTLPHCRELHIMSETHCGLLRHLSLPAIADLHLMYFNNDERLSQMILPQYLPPQVIPRTLLQSATCIELAAERELTSLVVSGGHIPTRLECRFGLNRGFDTCPVNDRFMLALLLIPGAKDMFHNALIHWPSYESPNDADGNRLTSSLGHLPLLVEIRIWGLVQPVDEALLGLAALRACASWSTLELRECEFTRTGPVRTIDRLKNLIEARRQAGTPLTTIRIRTCVWDKNERRRVSRDEDIFFRPQLGAGPEPVTEQDLRDITNCQIIFY